LVRQCKGVLSLKPQYPNQQAGSFTLEASLQETLGQKNIKNYTNYAKKDQYLRIWLPK
jgi:hypothetical protein